MTQMDLARQSRTARGTRRRVHELPSAAEPGIKGVGAPRKCDKWVVKTNTDTAPGTPTEFMARFGSLYSGILHGFDRLRFAGILRTIQDARGMMGYLHRANVLLKDFGAHAEALTERVRASAFRVAATAGLEVEYLRSSLERKQERAQEAVARRPGATGLVAIYSCVEPCRTFFVRGDKARQRLVLEAGSGKCLHLYFYFQHAIHGLMHVRLQTWYPFTVNVGLNGRQWLAQQMRAAGLGFTQVGNCFTRLDDLAAAQALCDQQLATDWSALLGGLLQECHPLAAEIGAPIGQSYYWSLKESEFASDVLFHQPAQLAALYPRLVHHGITHFGSEDILRFLGRRSPGISPSFGGELNSSLRRRLEGVRLKHYAAGNSIKIYDKEGQVLRVETTIHRPEVFKVYRPTAAPGPDGQEQLAWQKMRQGVADIHRRATVCRAANTRYLEALAQTSSAQPAGAAAEGIFSRVEKGKRRYRALNPWAKEDGALLEAISAGQWTINGLRNRDLREALFGTGATAAETKRLAARTTRLLALLRAHGILQKISATHRYQVTEKGRQIITALQAAKRASIDALTKLAA